MFGVNSVFIRAPLYPSSCFDTNAQRHMSDLCKADTNLLSLVNCHSLFLLRGGAGLLVMKVTSFLACRERCCDYVVIRVLHCGCTWGGWQAADGLSPGRKRLRIIRCTGNTRVLK